MKTKPWILMPLVALSLSSLSCVCHLPGAKHTITTNQSTLTGFDKSAELLRQKIAEVLPKGWTVQRSTNQITITRDEKIRSANLINAPPLDSEKEYEERFSPDTFSISLVLEPKLPQQEYMEKKRANDDISDKMQKQVELMTHEGIAHKFDDYTVRTEKGRILVDEYKKLKSSLHKLPDGFYGECGVYFRDWPWGLTIEPPVVSSECHAVSQSIRKVLQRY